MRRAFLALLALTLIAPASAAASGGGGFPTQGGGVTTADLPWSYVAVPAGRGHTLVQAIHRPDGAVQLYRSLPGNYGLALAANDGTQTGLSGDGTTLVLAKIENDFPPQRTHLLVLYAQGLTTRTRVSLPGYYTVDAVSPDGRYVFLVHYRDAQQSSYEVVSYDLQRNRLDPKPIMDPREPGEKMSGQPMSRVVSQDNRWVYTLYSAKTPFVHALDTVNRKAVCIDLDDIPQANITPSAVLTLTAGKLNVLGLADIDLRTYEVFASAPPVIRQRRAVATATPTPAAPKPAGTSPWPFVGLGVLALAGIGLLVRRRSVHDVEDLHVTVHHADEHPALRE